MEHIEAPPASALEAIGAVGRVPTIGKHRAANYGHIAEVIKKLDGMGLHAEADTIVWGVWFRILDSQREDFLVGDANERRDKAEARCERLIEALEHIRAMGPNPVVDAVNDALADLKETAT